MDSEKEGVFIVSCAGGRAVTARFARDPEGLSSPPSAVRCRIGGLRGGHSGIDIDKGRVNALATAAAALKKMRGSHGGVRLLSLDGGTQFNVIPRNAEFVVTGIGVEEVQSVVAELVDDLKTVESLATATVDRVEEVSSAPLPWGVVDFMGDLPKGVIAMDDGIPGLVHTSLNLGVARSNEKGAALLIKVRSAEDRQRDAECGKIAALARRCGGDSETGDGYPGWASSSNSKLVRCLSETYRDLFGRPAEIKGIHAGLEAGVVGAMIGSGELVSLGPTIENAHSPGERLQIESVEPVLQLLEAFIGSSRCHTS
jgi:dipeptidase D